MSEKDDLRTIAQELKMLNNQVKTLIAIVADIPAALLRSRTGARCAAVAPGTSFIRSRCTGGDGLLTETRFQMKRYFLLALAIVFTGGCQIDEPVGVEPFGDVNSELSAAQVFRGGGPVTVMTRNIYVGADIDPILTATDPSEIPVLVAQAFQTLLQTDFATRARLLAAEIGKAKPHLVGLQEVSLIRIQSPGDAAVGGTEPAELVFLDFLTILLVELAARGLDYAVVAQVQNADVEVPMITGLGPPPTFDDVRLTDFDVMLARGDVETANVLEQSYTVFLQVPIGGTTIDVRRGFVAVDATVRGKTYRVVNTHLEPAPIPELLPIQLAQASELIGLLSSETRPVILVGDLNTPAHLGPIGAPTFGLLLSEGYEDVWLARKGRPGPGLTCCHAPDLSNETPTFGQRIDLILVRNGLGLGPVKARVAGDEIKDKDKLTGLWPSDHAGLVAQMKIPVPVLVATP